MSRFFSPGGEVVVLPSPQGGAKCPPTLSKLPAPIVKSSVQMKPRLPHCTGANPALAKRKQEENLFLSAAGKAELARSRGLKATAGIFHCPAPCLSHSCHHARLV